MKQPSEIYDILKEKFQDSITEFTDDNPGEQIITVTPDNLLGICKFLKFEENLKFDSLMSLSGTDEKENLGVYYHLFSYPLGHKLTLKVLMNKESAEVQSVESLWKTANWHEREAFDLFGIKFSDHPDLRRILMPDDWPADSFPLRKDYENPEFYNGMKVPY